ncbi:hypothetical protein [Campylobacter sputorum]|uniref:hypothetical protein n=1 Tax=Campylobacter sputorum TaxID=206 RepID=UPI00053BF8F0|nr:hypothetical protein [Campylobacter sputorum]
MRFFILSLLINLVLLFVPNLTLSAKNEEVSKKIEIVLNENNTAFNDTKKTETIKSAEVIKEKEIKKTVKPKQETLKTKKVNKKNDKKPNLKNKPLKKSPQIDQTSLIDQSSLKEIQKDTSKSATLENLNNSKENDDFCKENIGFKVLNTKEAYGFPKKAKMLRLKGKFEVKVSFKIINSDIKIINIKGANEIFKTEAKKLTQNLNIEVLDKRVSECLIIKPFLFISN